MVFIRDNGKGRDFRMFNAVRKRVTWVNVAVTLALVFAMSGGAYAAKKYLITSTKQISPSVLSALKGKPGPAGAEGPHGQQGPEGKQGPAGPAGPKGENGATGNSGKNGENVNVTAASGSECSGLGGTKLSDGTGSNTVCNGANGKNGKEGAPWTVGNVLPAEATETGMWAFGPEAQSGGTVRVAFAFPIPLKAELGEHQIHFVTWAEQETKKVPAECKAKVNGIETEGSLSNPLASPGNLCVYEGIEGVEGLTGAKLNGIYSITGSPGASTTGAIGLFEIEASEANGTGTWAVTAEA